MSIDWNILGPVMEDGVYFGMSHDDYLAALWKVYSAGKDAAQTDGIKAQLDNVKVRNDEEVSVGMLNDTDISERLRKWSRD